jgi:hypothetical protein
MVMRRSASRSVVLAQVILWLACGVPQVCLVCELHRCAVGQP